MNKVILIGRLTADPEPKQTPTGTSVSRYRLAVDRPAKQGEEKTADFISCICYGNTADFANKYLHKGTKIAIEGRIKTGSYEKDGAKHYTTDIVVDRHEFCESRQGGGNQAASNMVDPAAADVTASDFTVMDDDGSDLPF